MKKHWKPLLLALLTMLLVCTCMSAMAETTEPPCKHTTKVIKTKLITHHHDGENLNAVYVEQTVCKDCKQVLDEGARFNDYEKCAWQFVKTVPPTCTEKGYDLYKCDYCGQTKKENEVAKKPHHVSAYKVVTRATCETDGVESGYCSSCGEYVERKLPHTGHNYQPDSEPSTCTTKGYTSQKCQNCGDVINYVELPLVQHSYSEWVVTTEPGCVTTGVATAKCSVCKELFHKDVPALGHSLEWKVTTKATCTAPAIETYTCKRCGITDGTRTAGDPLNHEVEWKKSKELSVAPTCSTAGKDVYVCSACGKTMKEETVPALNHMKNDKSQIVYHAAKDATCTEAGNTEYTECQLCGKVTGGTKTIFPALGHVFEDQTVVQEATCTQPGKAEVYCNRGCGECQAVVIPAKGHVHYEAAANWTIVTAPTCYSTGVEKNVCARCGGDPMTREIPKKAHLYATGAQVKANPALASSITGWSCTTDGTATVYCQYGCKECTTVTVPAMGHAWSDWEYDRKAPDCTHSMNATRHCLRGGCNAKETKQVAAAYGHSFDKNDPRNVAPTCTQDGLLFGKCLICNKEIVGERIPATGHNYQTESKPATCTEKGYTCQKCTICGTVDNYVEIPVADHKPVEIVVSKPSPSGAGVTEIRCSVCNELLSSKKVPYTDVRSGSIITGFGPMTRELVGGSTWNRVTPIDLSVEGTQTYDLIAANKYTVGTMTVTVANGTLTVSYKLSSTQIKVSSEALKIYGNLDALRADNAKTYALGAPIDIASAFGEDHQVILSLVLTATYDAAGSGVYGFTPNDASLAAMSGLRD